MPQAGDRITRGVDVKSLDHDKKWNFKARAQKGDIVKGGDIIGVVQETSVVEHRIMVPAEYEGEITAIKSGSYTLDETVATLKTANGTVNLTMLQRWPVRRGRPYKEKIAPDQPMVTGQRVIDTFFPIARGGVAASARARSAAARPWCSISWQSGRTRTSSYTSAAASAATR